MIGGLYEEALAGHGHVQVEYADGRRVPLPVEMWRAGAPGDDDLLRRCRGAVLDVGSGPGRLTAALAGRGLPALGIDIAPRAVAMTRGAGGTALRRDVFGRVPGVGRWTTVLLADGNIGIGGDPVALLCRVAGLLRPGGRALVEVECPGAVTRTDRVRLREGRRTGEWFPWATVAADSVGEHAEPAGLAVTETWTVARRWFAALTKEGALR